jgi:3-oxoacyl-[acyl-carrier-protein] synthase II
MRPNADLELISMQRRRVVITGIGVLVPGGKGKEEFWEILKTSRAELAVSKERISEGERYRYSGLIKEVELEEVPPIVLKQTDIATRFAMSTALMAIKDAELSLDEGLLSELGYFFGTELGGLSYAETEYRNYVERGFRYLSPYLSIGMFYSAPIGQLSIFLKTTGFSKTYCSGECSSSTAIGEAYRAILDAKAQVIIGGGYEKANTESSSLIYYYQDHLAYGDSAERIALSKPYNPESTGMLLSDGAGMVVMENYDYARSRNAYIYGEIVGFQQGFAVKNNPEVIKRVIWDALMEANLKPEEICYIHGSGLGLPVWDQLEIDTINEIFGEKVLFGSPGTMFGNTLGALGALELISSILSLENGKFCIYPNNEKVATPKEALLNILILTRGLDGNVVALIVKRECV